MSPHRGCELTEGFGDAVGLLAQEVLEPGLEM
jgi:hypothetical protein